MGFLADLGPVLSFQDSQKYQFTQKREAVKQFQRIYDKFFDKKTGCKQMLWGDEIEYQIVHFDHANRRVRLQCNTDYILEAHRSLNRETYECLSEEDKNKCWNDHFESMVEYGSWMVETIPMSPYQACCGMELVRQNLRIRNQTYRSLLRKDEAALSMTHFPLLGMPDSYIPNQEMQFKEEDDQTTKQLKAQIHSNVFGQSQYLDDQTLTNHPRFRHLSQNIRERRGENVRVESGVFQDKHTTEKTHRVDHMGFGMGMGCIQQTFATTDIDSCRHIYDQLSIFSPIMLAFTAATPILHGRLLDQDTRWNMIGQSTDCRNRQERDESSPDYIPKSRYSSISYFIGNTDMFRPEYNDINFNINLEAVTRFRKNSSESGLKLDENLQSHLGFLLARDQMVMFQREMESENFETSFEQFNSTNWNNVRFKPQPSLKAEDMAWRIEFRTMELQPTETENLYALFLVKSIANILMFKDNTLNFYIPISMVDANFERALKMNALLEQSFFFRVNVFDTGVPEILELTIKDYLCGCSAFPGLMSIITGFQEKKPCCYDKSSNEKLTAYVNDRCSGKIPTTASFIRKFVQTHPEYKQDSLLTQGITYDLLMRLNKIQIEDKFDYSC